VLSLKGRLLASYIVDRRLKRLHELLSDAVGDKALGEVQQLREDVTHFCGNVQVCDPAKDPHQERQQPFEGCQVLGRRHWRRFMPETMVPITLAASFG
jgi:hypothetical protein